MQRLAVRGAFAGLTANEAFGLKADNPRAPTHPAWRIARREIPSHSLGDCSEMASMIPTCERMIQSPRWMLAQRSGLVPSPLGRGLG